ncbi:hypothetical protein BLA24_13340 [Streptomyces cinnamoneus]|uniref:Uncharacterized protein n=1 Tax=Streptomyces cinnamoneus TaxID=53446 RepID=A0A2G1XK19_STRCJ|nr:hypothetical protein [Streptomyces cinnamoneus]PHQ51489.1 hypothetical protein BLA24_13340 [Streptomyces cinnamoneus]PPT11671.1 hypothetical protein CYQ11_01060 [Streptomyces cinnamoneus]
MKRRSWGRGAAATVGVAALFLTIGGSVTAAAPPEAAPAPHPQRVAAVAPHPVWDTGIDIPPNTTFGTIVACPAGEVISGGGGRADVPYSLSVSDSYQEEGANSWVWAGKNVSSRTVKVKALTICTRP